MTNSETVWFDTCSAFLNRNWLPERTNNTLSLRDRLHPAYELTITRWFTVSPTWLCLRIKQWPSEDGIYVPEERRSFTTLEELHDYLVCVVDLVSSRERVFFTVLNASLVKDSGKRTHG